MMSLRDVVAFLRSIKSASLVRVWKGNVSPDIVAAVRMFIETDVEFSDDNGVEYWTLSADGFELIAMADKAGY